MYQVVKIVRTENVDLSSLGCANCRPCDFCSGGPATDSANSTACPAQRELFAWRDLDQSACSGDVVRYELLVIGTDGCGVAAATGGARRGRRSAVAWDPSQGTNSADPLNRDAVQRLADDLVADALTGGPVHAARSAGTFTMRELRSRLTAAIQRERDELGRKLRSDRVDLLCGSPRFVNDNTIVVRDDFGQCVVGADRIVIATGQRIEIPARLEGDRGLVHGPDEILQRTHIPTRMVVMGAVPIGLHVGLLFACVGTHVIVVDGDHLSDRWSPPVCAALMDQAITLGVEFRSGVNVLGVDAQPPSGTHGRVWGSVHLEGGERIMTDAVLWAGRAVGNTDMLNLDAAGVMTDDSGRLWCDRNRRTWQSHILGIGTVVGFPHDGGDELRRVDRLLECAFGDSGTRRPPVIARRHSQACSPGR